MNNFRIIVEDGHKGAVLTATSESGELVIENTQDSRRSYPWRSTDASAQTITAVMPVTANGGGIFLSNTNITAAATVAVALKNGTTTLDTVNLQTLGLNLDGTRNWFAWFDEDPVDQYSLVITDTGNPAGYIQVQQIICGPYISAYYNFALGAKMRYNVDMRHRMTKGQTPRSSGTGAKRRQFDIVMDFLEESDREELVEKLLLYDMRDAVLFSAYPDRGGAVERHHMFAAKIDPGIEHAHWAQTLWEQGMRLIEV